MTKYVRGLIILFSFISLSGCEDPSVSLSSLGKKLPAPQLVGSSPFNQDFDNSNYVEIKGVCDSRLSIISLSFDKTNWATPPVAPTITGTTLPTGTANDIDCSDGNFDVYLTRSDITSLWPTQDPDSGVDHIYIKGSTLIGDSQILDLVNPNPGTGGGNGNSGGAATKLSVLKSFPREFAAANQCGSLNVSLTNDNGGSAIAPVAMSFSINALDSNNHTATIIAFNSWDDCNSSANGVTTMSLPAGQNNVQVVYRFPSTSVTSSLIFTPVIVTAPSGISAVPGTEVVTLRDSNGVRRWVAFDDGDPDRILANTCYPFTLHVYDYNNSTATDVTGQTITLTSPTGALSFYTSASCTGGGISSTLTFQSSTPGFIQGYVRYSKAANEATNNLDITLNASTTATNLDIPPLVFEIDRSGNDTISAYDFRGPNELRRGDCSPYTVYAENSNGVAVVPSVDIDVTLEYSGNGSFYTDSTCASTSVTNQTVVTLSTTHPSSTVYFKPTDVFSNIYEMKASASGSGSSTTRDVTVKLVATMLTLAPDVASNFPAETCTPFIITMLDNSGIIPFLGNITMMYYVQNPGTSVMTEGLDLYTASDCNTSSMLAQSTVIPESFPSVQTAFTLYVKADSALNGTNLNMTVTFQDSIGATLGQVGGLGTTRSFVITPP